MLGKERARTILEQVLALGGADETEALLLADEAALTRFAQNAIHQNVAQQDTVLRVRAVLDGRVGVASGNDLSREGVTAVFDRALQAARVQPPDPQFAGLPQPHPYPTLPELEEATASVTPAARAEFVGHACAKAEGSHLVAAGALETGLREVAVANSNGVLGYHAGSSAEFVTVIMGADSSGYGFALANTLSDLDVEAAVARAVDKALTGRAPQVFPAGHYPVVLEPDATADLLGSMAYTSFGALQLEEGSSFLTRRLGQPVLSSAVTITDDALNPAILPMPFDFEGSPKTRVSIIDGGVATGVVHDTYTASRAGTQSTGHAFPAPNPYGPRATHLSLAPGTASVSDLVASIDEGLLITRFHYTRVVRRPTVTVTGMTRDGTFLIRDGEIAHPVRNLRFTQSYVQALQDGCVIGAEQRLCGEYGPYLCPAVYIPEFHFTGVTDF